jgi:hypothetical protein
MLSLVYIGRGRRALENGGNGSGRRNLDVPDMAIHRAALVSRGWIVQPRATSGQRLLVQWTAPCRRTVLTLPRIILLARARLSCPKHVPHVCEVRHSFVSATSACCMCCCRIFLPPRRACPQILDPTPVPAAPYRNIVMSPVACSCSLRLWPWSSSCSCFL